MLLIRSRFAASATFTTTMSASGRYPVDAGRHLAAPNTYTGSPFEPFATARKVRGPKSVDRTLRNSSVPPRRLVKTGGSRSEERAELGNGSGGRRGAGSA